jgi:hypothetical protein
MTRNRTKEKSKNETVNGDVDNATIDVGPTDDSETVVENPDTASSYTEDDV